MIRLLAISLAACFPIILTDIYLPALVRISQHFGITFNLAQSSISVFMIGIAFSQLFFGAVSESAGRTKPLIFGITLSIVGCIICYFSRSIYLFLIGRFISGVGAGAPSALWRALVSDMYTPERTASIYPYIQVAMIFILPVAPALGGYVHHYFDWRANFAFSAILGLILLFLIVVFLPKTKKSSPSTISIPFAFKSIKTLLRTREFMIPSLVACISYSGLISWITIAPGLLMKHLQLHTIYFGWAMLICSFTSLSFSTLFRNTIGKNLSHTQLMNISVSIQTITGILLITKLEQHPDPLILIICTIICQLCAIMIIFPAASATAFRHINQTRGIASALYASIQLIGGFISSSLIAHLPENSTEPLGFVFLFIAIATALLQRSINFNQ